ncbi:unnamed protein product [Rhizophagus irregularis]|uniref:Uncharacterized protein n=1 Tax=Rhizophagus irregularis TaxID=588596 RepID=A0A916EKB2_9GLOM|nr:unnamed protein product [Rhizophagus irregularis]CAB4460274.1 unnamed protein product [Rhizophagus irregularis]CAB5163353.1 unnamed protein product [Rhizophagus irregularis]CAB5380147.1 unnamed protein product [Rhizophagus irregularis]CAB5393995.1 unnamed protein product [Rhizophagus irregularis]
MPKTLRDMYSELIRAIDFNDQRAKKFKPLALYISGYGSNSQGYGVLVDQFAFFDINLSAQDYHKGQPTNFKYSEH